MKPVQFVSILDPVSGDVVLADVISSWRQQVRAYPLLQQYASDQEVDMFVRRYRQKIVCLALHPEDHLRDSHLAQFPVHSPIPVSVLDRMMYMFGRCLEKHGVIQSEKNMLMQLYEDYRQQVRQHQSA